MCLLCWVGVVGEGPSAAPGEILAQSQQQMTSLQQIAQIRDDSQKSEARQPTIVLVSHCESWIITRPRQPCQSESSSQEPSQCATGSAEENLMAKKEIMEHMTVYFQPTGQAVLPNDVRR